MPELSTETALDIYRRTTTIRQCDERFRTLIRAGAIRVIYYPVWGQEVLAASVGAALRPDDYLVTTYRGVHDQLAKGVPLASIRAEFLGRVTGTCKGKGGPMHITDPAHGLMVTTGIVGAGLPIAGGLALSSQLAGDGRVTVVNFGDGATNIGAFHESLNMAAVWQLPVVFVCQNNGYAEHTSLAEGTAGGSVVARAAAYGLPGLSVKGNDAAAMYAAATEAVDRARSGGGPTLIDAATFRFGGHAMNDQMGYMAEGELAAAMAADPVPRLRAWLIDQDLADEDAVAQIETEVRAELDAAVEAALAAPEPDPSELLTDVYAVSA